MHVHIQISKNQMQRKSLMKPDGGKKTPYLCRNKDKNILDFLSEAMQVQS